jgi:hypothetical protein
VRKELSMGLLLVIPLTDVKHDTSKKNKKEALKNWKIFPKNTRYLPKIKTPDKQIIRH